MNRDRGIGLCHGVLPQPRSRRGVALACVLVLCASHSLPAADAPGTDREAILRAAYLVSIAKFVEWPAASATPEFTLCFKGATAVREALKGTAAGKLIGGQAIAVRDVSDGQDLAECRVLYLEARAMSRVSFAPEGSQGRPAPVLTVSDAKDFAEHDGMVELFAEKNRLRFSVNVVNAKRAGLRVRSELLEMASHVVKEGP